MDRLNVMILQIGREVKVGILHQDESLRNTTPEHKILSKDDKFEVASAGYPAYAYGTLFLRGRAMHHDAFVEEIKLPNEEAAFKLVKTIEKHVKYINSPDFVMGGNPDDADKPEVEEPKGCDWVRDIKVIKELLLEHMDIAHGRFVWASDFYAKGLGDYREKPE